MKKFKLKLCPLNTYLFVTVIRIELQQYDRMAMAASLEAFAAMMKQCSREEPKGGVAISQQQEEDDFKIAIRPKSAIAIIKISLS